MTEWERVTDSFAKMAEACNEAAKAIVDFACTAVKTLCESLYFESLDFESLDFESIIQASAYIQAQKEHPEWVHKANYSKKKRTRKKYHDRIMKQYWRNQHGERKC